MDEGKIKVTYDEDRDAWRGDFEHEGKFYMADLCEAFDHHRPEIMIFTASNNGSVRNWGGVYTAYPETVDRETLVRHIQAFTAEPEEGSNAE